jgi:hypothetical protein
MVAARAGDNPALTAVQKSSRADSGTSLLPCLRNAIEQHPSTNQVLQRPIETDGGVTTLVQISRRRSGSHDGEPDKKT